MKIVLDLRTYDWTGIGRVAKGMAHHLPKKLSDTEFIFILNPGQADDINYQNVIKEYITAPTFNLKEHYQVFNVLKKHAKVDVYHATQFNLPLWISKETKVVTNIYDLLEEADEYRTVFHKLYYLYFIRYCLRRSDAIVAQSKYTYQSLKKYHNYSNAVPIYPGYDVEDMIGDVDSTEAKTLYNLPEKYIFYIGINKPRKNLRRLVAAYEKILSRNSCLDTDIVLAGPIGGKHDVGYDIVRDIEDKGLSHRVHILGFVPDELIKELYYRAMFSIVPSYLESGYSYPALESISVGTPVMLNIHDMKEFGHCNIYYFDALDADDMAKKIEEMIDNDGFRKKLFDKSKLITKQMSWCNYVKYIGLIYQKK
jgi:glycosyltransferase involved in cell wall biosynthesis